VTVRPLRLLGDPVLRTPCDRVLRFDAALSSQSWSSVPAN
jgi:hypothetical protein